MEIKVLLLSIILGLLLGKLNGHSLIYQKENAHFNFYFRYFGLLRLLIFLIIFIYLLQSQLINFIIFSMSFIIGFWFIIINQLNK